MVKVQTTLVAGPRNHQARTAVSRRGGGRFLPCVCQDLSQRTYNNDLALATFLARVDFNSLDKRTDDLNSLRASRFIIQYLLQPDDLSAVEVREIRMDGNLNIDLLSLQVGTDLALTGLQTP